MESTIPIFIGGAGRSATTLVVDMLGLHPALSPIYETAFVLEIAHLLFGIRPLTLEQMRLEVTNCMDKWTLPLPFPPHNKRPYEQFRHGPHYILFDRPFAMQKTVELLDRLAAGHDRVESFRAFVLALFEEHARRDGKPRWVNKTPAYVLQLPLIGRIFPGMRFIHCIRDGRDTARSAMTRNWGPRDLKDAAAWWVNRVRQGVEYGRLHPEQYFEVRFEDLLLEPEKTLGGVLAWLGENADTADIVHKYQGGSVRIDPSRIGDWRRTFSDNDRRTFQDVAGEMLAHFGYQ